jgi:hypothetical protein
MAVDSQVDRISWEGLEPGESNELDNAASGQPTGCCGRSRYPTSPPPHALNGLPLEDYWNCRLSSALDESPCGDDSRPDGRSLYPASGERVGINVDDSGTNASCRKPMNVLPAKAGIQTLKDILDPGFRRGDVKSTTLRVGVKGFPELMFRHPSPLQEVEGTLIQQHYPTPLPGERLCFNSPLATSGRHLHGARRQSSARWFHEVAL